jgi:hypothetical protein
LGALIPFPNTTPEKEYILLCLFPQLFPNNTTRIKKRENSVSGNRARARVVLPTIKSRAAKNESKRFEDVLRKAHVQRSKKLRVVVVVVVVVVHSARILSSVVETKWTRLEKNAVETKWTRLEKNAFSSNVSSYFALYLFNSIAI